MARPLSIAAHLPLLVLASAALCLSAQPPATPSSYIDLPLAQLKQRIPSLAGLHPDDDQQSLQLTLLSIADSIAIQVPQLPNIVAREEVYRSQQRSGQQAPQQMIAVARNSGPGVILTPQDATGQQYRYLLLCHHTDHGISVEESRTDPAGRPVNLVQAEKNPLGSGFAYQWLLFSSANQPEFRFRSLGQQTIAGHPTNVIAFAQIPSLVHTPAVFAWRGKQASYYYQGILWADQETAQIVFLRTDLLTPLPNMQLQSLTTELQFSSVHIRDYSSELWLPQNVHLTIAQDRYDIDEVHRYSDYHLYHSQATILAAP